MPQDQTIAAERVKAWAEFHTGNYDGGPDDLLGCSYSDYPLRLSDLLALLAEVGEVPALRHEIEQLRAGEAEESGDTAAVPTPAQWLRRFNNLTPEQRLQMAERLIDASTESYNCFVRDHENQIERYRAERDALQARLDAVRAGALNEAADEIRREARWQKESQMRGMFANGEASFDRLLMLERIVRAAARGGTDE